MSNDEIRKRHARILGLPEESNWATLVGMQELLLKERFNVPFWASWKSINLAIAGRIDRETASFYGSQQNY